MNVGKWEIDNRFYPLLVTSQSIQSALARSTALHEANERLQNELLQSNPLLFDPFVPLHICSCTRIDQWWNPTAPIWHGMLLIKY
jgi:hypothetical protein